MAKDKKVRLKPKGSLSPQTYETVSYKGEAIYLITEFNNGMLLVSKSNAPQGMFKVDRKDLD